MSQYRFSSNMPELHHAIDMVAEQDGVDVADVRVKLDPHPHAPPDEVVLCTTAELDHWPNARREAP